MWRSRTSKYRDNISLIHSKLSIESKYLMAGSVVDSEGGGMNKTCKVPEFTIQTSWSVLTGNQQDNSEFCQENKTGHYTR